MKNLLIFLFAAIWSFTLTAQNPTNSGNLADGFKIMRGESKTNPFLADNWYVGYGVFEDGRMSQAYNLNYDIHDNNLVYKEPGSNTIMKLIDPGFVGFVLKGENEEYLFSKIDGSNFDNEKKEAKFYRIVKAPSRNMIVELEKELDDPNATGWQSSTQNTKNAEYELKTRYYVLRKDGKYDHVKLKNRSILKVYNDKQKELKKYMKMNDIDIKTPEDLFRVVEYYHSL